MLLHKKLLYLQPYLDYLIPKELLCQIPFLYILQLSQLESDFYHRLENLMTMYTVLAKDEGLRFFATSYIIMLCGDNSNGKRGRRMLVLEIL